MRKISRLHTDVPIETRKAFKEICKLRNICMKSCLENYVKEEVKKFDSGIKIEEVKKRIKIDINFGRIDLWTEKEIAEKYKKLILLKKSTITQDLYQFILAFINNYKKSENIFIIIEKTIQ